MKKRIILSILIFLLVAVLAYNVIFLVNESKAFYSCEDAHKAYLENSLIKEEPLAAYVVEKPNAIITATARKAESVKVGMTLGEVIALIGKPQRFYGTPRDGISLQWDLKFNKTAIISFNESYDPAIYHWDTRLTVREITLK